MLSKNTSTGARTRVDPSPTVALSKLMRFRKRTPARSTASPAARTTRKPVQPSESEKEREKQSERERKRTGAHTLVCVQWETGRKVCCLFTRMPSPFCSLSLRLRSPFASLSLSLSLSLVLLLSLSKLLTFCLRSCSFGSIAN